MKEVNKRKLYAINESIINSGKLDNGQINWLINQVKEYEKYKQYIMYYVGKDKVNEIEISMKEDLLHWLTD